MRHRAFVLSLVLIIALGSPFTSSAGASDGRVTIGTGSRNGVYHQVGRALCRLLGAAPGAEAITCKARSSGGSIANLRSLRAGDIEFAIAQSDAQYRAVHGIDAFIGDQADGDLRSVLSLHGEAFTLVARRDAGIEQLRDLVSKRVNIGNPGSGQRGTMEIVMLAMGWERRSFSLINELPASQQSLALCHDNVQAMVYTAGHPNSSVAQAVRLCDAVIVEVSGRPIDILIAKYPFYERMDIPGGLYAGNPHDVRTFGVLATLVTSAKVDSERVYQLTKTLFENLDSLRRQHPSLRHLIPENMISRGLTAPLHEGALRYYKERGWL